jgi:hypothetical protein
VASDLAPGLPVRLFIEALNARDLDTLRTLVADDVEFRNADGAALRGEEGLRDIVMAAEDTDLLLAREGAERVEGHDGIDHLTVPVRVLVGRGELHGTAVSDIRDGRVAAFAVVSVD